MRRRSYRMTEEDMRLNKAALLKVFTYFDSFCRKHSLRYYCCGGTEIGAVRHSGFIPWDDDIDVLMPRPDFDKLVELSAREMSADYSLEIPKADNLYYLPYAKLCDTHSTILEYRDLRSVLGFFIDIFPIDGCAPDRETFLEDIKLFEKYRRRLFRLSRVGDCREIAYRLSKFNFTFVFRMIAAQFFRKRRRAACIARMEEIERKYNFEDSEYVAAFSGYKYDKERIPKKWLGNGVEFDFENLKVFLPDEYDAHLRHIFGDYMQLPPEKERRSAQHKIFYFNPDERVSLKQIFSGHSCAGGRK